MDIDLYMKNTALPFQEAADGSGAWLAEGLNKTDVASSYVWASKEKITYFNSPAAFDIETTSFRTSEGAKAACMYVWQLGVNGRAVYGRTWPDLVMVLQDLADALQLGRARRLVIWVHNLAFEFQFMRKWFGWPEVFAVNDRKPVRALSDLGIEFRCSYILTNESLEKVGKDLRLVPVQKQVGELDYTLMRHPGTELTPADLDYCLHDIRVVESLIIDKIDQDGSIAKIPMTKTGYVRRYMRNKCLYTEGKRHTRDRKFVKYRQIMKALTMTPEEYKQCKRAFQGGFTHANAHYTGQTVEEVTSRDIASSYPTVMAGEKFPMSRARTVYRPSWDYVEDCCKKRCCLLDLHITGLVASRFQDHPISASKCRLEGSWQEDNGRLVTADELWTTCTDVDLDIYKRFYEWASIECSVIRSYHKDYLPHDFIEGLLQLYKDKTSLKGVEGREADYMQAKGNINSCFGMTVTDIVRPLITYDSVTDTWGEQRAVLQDQLDKYNASKGRFLFYPWGVWVTAYARRNLFEAIEELGPDYIYSDTDSVKYRNRERHEAFFERYNEKIHRKMLAMCSACGIDPDATAPLDPKGRARPLGVFEYEGTYDLFRTLGAKRYLTAENDEISLTCAGVNKLAKGYIKSLGNTTLDAFSAFSDGLYIPAEATGKLTHTYIDDEIAGTLTDYTGTQGVYHERSCVHLEGADYSLGLSQLYLEYLLNMKEVIIND